MMLSHGEPVTWTTCSTCFAYIPRDNIHAHRDWHLAQEARETLAYAHQENLIERMHTAEKQIEAAVARIWIMERNAGGLPHGSDPLSHHHQME